MLFRHLAINKKSAYPVRIRVHLYFLNVFIITLTAFFCSSVNERQSSKYAHSHKSIVITSDFNIILDNNNLFE